MADNHPRDGMAWLVSEAQNVRTTDDQLHLHLGSVLTRKTLGVNVTSEVVEFEPVRSLAWGARGALSRGFHRFDFASIEGSGRFVITQEVHAGIGPGLVRGRLKQDLARFASSTSGNS